MPSEKIVREGPEEEIFSVEMMTGEQRVMEGV